MTLPPHASQVCTSSSVGAALCTQVAPVLRRPSGRPTARGSGGSGGAHGPPGQVVLEAGGCSWYCRFSTPLRLELAEPAREDVPRRARIPLDLVEPVHAEASSRTTRSDHFSPITTGQRHRADAGAGALSVDAVCHRGLTFPTHLGRFFQLTHAHPRTQAPAWPHLLVRPLRRRHRHRPGGLRTARGRIPPGPLQRAEALPHRGRARQLAAVDCSHHALVAHLEGDPGRSRSPASPATTARAPRSPSRSPTRTSTTASALRSRPS